MEAHPCENINILDNIVTKLFHKTEFIEEFCINLDLNNLKNTKRYFIFNIKLIYDKTKLLLLINRCIKKLGIGNLKPGVSRYVEDTIGISLYNIPSKDEVEKFFDKKNIENFIVKYDSNKNFNIYISEGVSVNSKKKYKTISVVNGIILEKKYSIINYPEVRETLPSIDGAERIYSIDPRTFLNIRVKEETNPNSQESVFLPFRETFINSNFETSYVSFESDGSLGVYYRKKEKKATPLEDVLEKGYTKLAPNHKDYIFWKCFIEFINFNSTKSIHQLRKDIFNFKNLCLYIFILWKRGKSHALAKFIKIYKILRYLNFIYDTSLIDYIVAILNTDSARYSKVLLKDYSLKPMRFNKYNLFSINLLNSKINKPKTEIDSNAKTVVIKFSEEPSENISNVAYIYKFLNDSLEKNIYLLIDHYQIDFFKLIFRQPNVTLLSSLKDIEYDLSLNIHDIKLMGANNNWPRYYNFSDQLIFNVKKGAKKKIGINLFKENFYLSSLGKVRINLEPLKDIDNLYPELISLWGLSEETKLEGIKSKKISNKDDYRLGLTLIEKAFYLSQLDSVITFDNLDIHLYLMLGINTYLILPHGNEQVRWPQETVSSYPNLRIIDNITDKLIVIILENLKT